MTAETHTNHESGGPQERPASSVDTRPAPANESSPQVPLAVALEALLFVAPGAVTAAQLAAALELSVSDVEAALAELDRSLAGRGLRLQSLRGRFQLVSAPEAAHIIERFLGLESAGRLSRAALEALAIILYRQPVTRPQIDAIRGVNSDYVVKSLLLKGLVQEVGRAELPGRPILYSVTTECLQYFGLASLDELPPLNLDPALQGQA